MSYDTRIAVVIRADLAEWQKLNVACFLAGGLVGECPALAGEPYVDASGRRYGPLIRQPILVFAGSSDDLSRTLQRAAQRRLTPSIYTKDLFSTTNDADNRTAVAACGTEALDLVGLAVHGPKRDVDLVTKGLRLHP